MQTHKNGGYNMAKSLKFKITLLISITLGIIAAINIATIVFLSENRIYNLKLYIILMIIISSLSGLILSSYFVYIVLKPISAQNQKFNQVMDKLSQFENSTKGKLVTEANRTVAIVKNIQDPLIVLDINAKIKLINNACKLFFNINEASSLNCSFYEVFSNPDFCSLVKSILDTKKDSSQIIKITKQNNNYYFNVNCTIIREEGLINGVVISLQNITEIKQLDKVKADFISTISHEFKTPLTSIIMGTSLLEDNNVGILNDNQRKILDTMKEDGEKLSSLVTNLLQLSKIEWSKSIFNLKECSIIGIIENSIKGFYGLAHEKDITLYYDADENLPKVIADSEKVTWVINNLLSNAFKYTNSGDEICIRAHAKDKKMYISVKDTGAGIPQEYLDKIFDKFIQVKGYDSEMRGTGLGLTIAREIVEQHSGEIWCQSELDAGSTFTFTLKLA